MRGKNQVDMDDGEDKYGNGGGCHVKTSTGFILVLLAMLVAVGVGIIVHFAGGGARPAVCQCDWRTQSPPSVAELRGQCQQLAQSNDDVICKACDSHKTTMMTTTKSTSSQTSFTTSSAMTTEMTSPPMTSALATTKAPPVNYRLPGDVTPIHYWLELQPHIYGDDTASFTFNGSVTVRMRAHTATSQIVLHSRGLTVPNETMELRPDRDGNTAPAITRVRSQAAQDFLILELAASLTPQHEYLLTLTFSGNLTDSGVGLYWSSYRDGNETVYLATSKFEAPYARRAFPCFDEPRMKATFDVTLVRRNDTSRDYNSFSNEDLLVSEDRGRGWVADSFLRTPPMSTYLLAFVVCDFLVLSNTSTVSGIQYRTLARPNAIQHAQYAQTNGLDLYNWLETTFDPPYNLSKLDNIAIPDFLAGAMENWGLITYRDTILYEEGVSTASDQDWTVEVIAHELTHMWFGDVVSPKWWSWLWLNEAFASFFDTLVVDKLHPSFRKMEQFIVQSVHATMYTDSSVTSHPITATVESPSEIQDIFDSITYTKGACIVRLMYHILGEETFFRGLNRYLDRHQYSVAEHQDLWEALNEEAALENRTINVTDVMDPWVTQQNFPVINVTRSRDFTITVTQQRYLRSPDMKDDGNAMYGYTWNVPITLASSLRPQFRPSMLYEDLHWLDRRLPSLEITDNATLPATSDVDSWVLVNVQQLGFYRVNYDVSNWEALIRQLKRDHTAIHPINRAQIINDAWSLAKAGQLNLSIAFRTLDFLKNDTDYVPWRALQRELGSIDEQLRYSDLYGDFKRMMRRLVQKAFDTVGFDVDTSGAPVDVFESTRFVSYACTYGLPSCVQAAVQSFRNWATHSARIHPDRQGIVLCTAVQAGDETEWNLVLERYRRADSSTEKLRLLTALSCTWQPWLLHRLLTMTLDPNEIKSQDIRTVINAVSQNLVGRDLAWMFLRANYRDLVDKLTSSALSSVIATVTSTFNTKAQLKDLETFVAGSDVRGGASALKRAVETCKENVHWLDSNYNLVRDWLASSD